MGFRFRKTFRIMPGVRLNLTHRGVSTTLGASPLSVSLGRKTRATASLPGTGLSFVHEATCGADKSEGQPSSIPTKRRRRSNLGNALGSAAVIGLIFALIYFR